VAIRLPIMFGVTSWCQCFVTPFASQASRVPVLSKRWLPLGKIYGLLTLWTVWHVGCVSLWELDFRPKKGSRDSTGHYTFSTVKITGDEKTPAWFPICFIPTLFSPYLWPFEIKFLQKIVLSQLTRALLSSNQSTQWLYFSKRRVKILRYSS